MPQLRQNIITGEWVVIAPERAKRPNDFVTAETVKPGSKIGCVFCMEHENYTKYRLRSFESQEIYVVTNKFPAFVETKDQSSPRTFHVEDGFYHAKPSLGGHDVLVVKNHNLNLYTFTENIWHELVAMIAKRYLYWQKDRNTDYTMAIYNEGQRAGASILHPHAQLFASDIFPNQITKELHGSEQYYEKHAQCVFCELIEHEKSQKIRIIYESDSMIAFTFYAARFPFEIWILPKKHASHYETTTRVDHRHIADCMKAVVGKLGQTLQNPSANFYIHDLPLALTDSKYYHWHIEIAPRVSLYGGYELGSGVVIDVMSPEEAAEYLNKN